jgi:hypothetical protein
MKDYKKLYDEEMERQEWENHRQRTESERAYQEREAERRQQRIEYTRYADSWDDGLRKNIRRLEGELRDSLAFAESAKDEAFDHSANITFWREQVAINKAAFDFLAEEMTRIRPITAKLQARIDALERRARKRVVKRIQETLPGNTSTIECLIDGNPSELLDW